MFLQNKRILFLSFQLFGYQDEIKSELEKNGAEVDYFDERPANTFFVKAMIRINRNILAKYIDQYHANIVEQTKDKKYDFIFFIKGEAISKNTVQQLRSYHPKAKFIIYHWDSIANNHNALRLLPYFDLAFSFDKIDCDRLGINFLPLFYLNDYWKISESGLKSDHDLLFVGTTHSDRYLLVKNIESQLERQGRNSFIYFFFPSKLLYYKMKLQNKYLRGTSAKDFHFKPVNKEQLLRLCERSFALLDVQHPRQTGLTMRCIETLGARRKLITTNQHIKEYDFYDKENILVIDRQNPVIPQDFFSLPYKKLPDSLYQKYSLKNWLGTIFQ